MTAAEVRGLSGHVSRETDERLESFCAAVEKWTRHINLVSAGSLRDIWSRHVFDSAQLFAERTVNPLVWADLGSGGGFPGIVVAILAREMEPTMQTVLVESDQRKAAFLRTVSAQLDLKVRVEAKRIELVEPLGADVLSARALAPVIDLCGHAVRHLSTQGLAVFPKGKSWQEELETAEKVWSFDVEVKPSLTDTLARIILLKGLKRK